MQLFSTMLAKFQSTQFLYALAVIILIPVIIIGNTLFLLYSIQRDNKYELNNKAYLVESLIGNQISEHATDKATLQRELTRITSALSDIKALEILKIDAKTNIVSLATTSYKTKFLGDPVLNKLAWISNQSYSKELFTSLSGDPERVVLVVAPITDADNQKVGVINLYLSATQMDTMFHRTEMDSIIILIVSILLSLLLLWNHFRFFETSLLVGKLKELDKAKDEFISVASHELRNPIIGVKGYASMLLEDSVVQSNAETKATVDKLMQSIKRLRELVEDLLNTSRIEQDRITLEMTNCALKEIIQTVVNDLHPQAEAKKLKLHYIPLEKPIIINCDKSKMQEVLMNLVSNAIKYTPAGEVTITHELSSQSVKTLVHDTGVGISQDNMQKLFKKFSRIHNEKTQNVPGTGLGLWITKQLVEKMNGTISVESIANQGTQFIITFPLQK